MVSFLRRRQEEKRIARIKSAKFKAQIQAINQAKRTPMEDRYKNTKSALDTSQTITIPQMPAGLKMPPRSRSSALLVEYQLDDNSRQLEDVGELSEDNDERV